VQKGGKITHLLRLSRDLLQQKIQSWSLLLNHKEVFSHDPFKPNVIENPYSFITHILLFIHVHFLIITYIHISCIFSKLVYQRASVCTTQFIYIYIVFMWKSNCYYLNPNRYYLICYCLKYLIFCNSLVEFMDFSHQFNISQELLTTHNSITYKI